MRGLFRGRDVIHRAPGPQSSGLFADLVLRLCLEI